MKKIDVNLGMLVRMQKTVTVRVPDDFDKWSEANKSCLMSTVHNANDGNGFTDDPNSDYCEEGSHDYRSADADAKTDFRAFGADHVIACDRAKTPSDAAYTITVNENHIQVILAALDLFARIGVGQFDEVLHVYDRGAKLADELRTRMRDGLSYVKSVVGHPPNGSHGIHQPEVDDDFRIACDIQRVIRHRLAWDRDPKGGMRVDFDKSCAFSNEPLITIKSE